MWQVSETFRQNCYDPEKAQRMLFVSDDLSLSNEDISAQSKVRFNISSITSTEQVQFGCTPCNTVNISVLNEDGRITADSIVGKEFKCSVGVEVSDDDYYSPRNAITAVDTGVDTISVHSVAPYIRGNCTFESVLPQLMNGDKCKIMYLHDVLYFVVFDGEDMYYAKHTKVASHSYSEYEEPTATEKMMLDRIMNDSSFDAVAYYEGGMAEFTYDHDSFVPGEWATVTGSIVQITDAIEYPIASWVVGLGMTPSASGIIPSDYVSWLDLKARTWGDVKTDTWGFYSGYSVFKCIRYEAVPYGVWHFDRPRRINSAVLTLNGRDRMTIFDEDSANFASSMANTALTVKNLIVAIANYKGVPVGDLSGLNEVADTQTVDASVYYQNKSLKDLLSYAFEVGGANCMIDREGKLCASNSDNDPVALPFVFAFDVADFTAHTIGEMLIYRNGESVEYQTDDTVEDGVMYDWSDNPYFNTLLVSGSWFSEGVNKKYGGFRNAITNTYTDFSLWGDDVYSWTEDEVTYREPIFTMSVEWGGIGMSTYSNYGDENRQYASYNSRMNGVTSSTESNLQGFNKAQRADRLYFDENGLTVESNGLRILNENGDAVFYADDEGNLTLKGAVAAESGSIGNWDVTQYGLRYESETGTGASGIISLEPHWGMMEFQAIGKGVSRVGIGYNHIFFDECDSNGDFIYSTSGVIEFFPSETGNTLTVGMRQYSGSTKTLEIDLIGDKVFIAASDLRLSGLPTTTSSSNMVVTGTRVYQSVSLQKYKDNVKTIANASETVDNLRGVSFTSKCEGDDPKKVFYGFIAEEVEKACPELATYEDGKLQSVQYDRVCALLIEDNKACHRRIEALEKRLEELERRLDK